MLKWIFICIHFSESGPNGCLFGLIFVYLTAYRPILAETDGDVFTNHRPFGPILSIFSSIKVECTVPIVLSALRAQDLGDLTYSLIWMLLFAYFYISLIECSRVVSSTFGGTEGSSSGLRPCGATGGLCPLYPPTQHPYLKVRA